MKRMARSGCLGQIVTVVLFAILLVGTAAWIATAESGEGISYDFRKATWGMSRLDIILAEDKLPNWDDLRGQVRQLGYRFTSLDGDQPLIAYLKENDIEWAIADVQYELVDDKLTSVEVTVSPPLINDANFDYLRLYDVLSLWIEEQYGEGIYTEHWKHGPKVGNMLAYIYVGELSRVTSWYRGRSIIILRQFADVHLGTEIIRTRVEFADWDYYVGLP